MVFMAAPPEVTKAGNSLGHSREEKWLDFRSPFDYVEGRAGLRGHHVFTVKSTNQGGTPVRPHEELLRTVEALVRTATGLQTRVPQRLHAVKILLRIANRPEGKMAGNPHIVEATVGLNRALPFIEDIANSDQLSQQTRSRRYSQLTRSRAAGLAIAIRTKRLVKDRPLAAPGESDQCHARCPELPKVV
jgi:hypothetical protein